MGHLGLSYVGFFYLILLFLPNLIWAENKPEGYDPSGENPVLLLGIYGRVVWMLLAAAILGIGHIGIHLQHRRQLEGTP